MRVFVVFVFVFVRLLKLHFAHHESFTCHLFSRFLLLPVFDKSEENVVMLKFKEVVNAEECMSVMGGGDLLGRKTRSIYWDGVTDYTNKVANEQQKAKEEEKRLEDFGAWIDGQDELPEELRLQT